ncbi:hypothetical protein SprV_0902690400 [Sparganum proliferum]
MVNADGVPAYANGDPSPFRLDKIIFFLSMLTSCLFGILLQKSHKSRNLPPHTRLLVCHLGGCIIILVCYGSRSIHIFAMCAVSYAFLRLLSPLWAFRLVFSYSLLYLSWANIYRMSFDYGSISADVSLPMMVLVQRLTLLAANLLDGDTIRKECQHSDLLMGNGSLPADNNGLHVEPSGDGGGGVMPSPPTSEVLAPRTSALTALQREHAVLQMPSPLEFFSYCVNFQTILVGPPLSFKDYLIYIEGRQAEYLSTETEKAYFEQNRERIIFPKEPAITLGLRAFGFLSMYLLVCRQFPVSFYTTDEFGAYSLSHKIAYLFLTGWCMRQHYYFAWTLAGFGCLLSGLGFSGFGDHLVPQYKLAESFRFRKVEFPGSIKELTDNWNVQTLQWLRLSVFERLPRKYKVLGVFAVSTAWHGFYPGYYLFFGTMLWYLWVGRAFRRQVRPWILSHLPDTKWTASKVPSSGSVFHGSSELYDVISRVVTYFLVNYTALAFVLLSFEGSLTAWRKFYFLGHVLCALVQITLMFWRPKVEPVRTDSTTKQKSL